MSLTTPRHNTDALLIGTGEFSFSESSSTVAQAVVAGYRDFGNVTAFTPQLDVTKQDHKGSYRGKLIKDKSINTEQGLTYILKIDEWKLKNLLLLFGGDVGDGWTQAAYTGLTGNQPDTFTFSGGSPSTAGNWYDITYLGDRLMHLTSVNFVYEGAVSATCDSTANTIGATAHGRSNGDRVFFTAAVMPTGLSANTAYYVVNAAADTFKVATTSGGSAIDFTTAGTTVVFHYIWEEGTQYEVDLVLGRIRFAAVLHVSVSVSVTAPVIDSTDDRQMFSLIPLQTITRHGMGRLVCYDQDDDNKLVFDHRDFYCELSVENAAEINGTNWAEIQIRVTVDGAIVGEVFVREDEPAVAA